MTSKILETDFAIVGAGIAGASLAWRLASHPARPRVLLLEREAQPGYHSTGRSAAMFMASYGPPLARALTRASRAFYQHPPAELGCSTVLSPRGVIYLASADQLASLDALQAELAPACPGLRRIDAAEVLARVPCLRPDRVAAGLLDEDSQDIDVHSLHQGFLRGLRAAGGQLRCHSEVVGAQGRPDGHWHLQLGDGCVVQATTLVNAAGAWADELARIAGAAPVGLQPRRRSAFTFDAPPGMDVRHWPLVADVDERWYLKPDAGRLLGSPANADDCPAHDVRPEELDIALGLHHIVEATGFDIRRPASTWAGLRSFVADGELVIGWDSDHPGGRPGLFWCAGQGGYGIQSAAGASLAAAALLMRDPWPQQLQAEGLSPLDLSPRRNSLNRLEGRG